MYSLITRNNTRSLAKNLRRVLLITFCGILMACNSETTYEADDEHYAPTLYNFHVIDSYGINSEYNPFASLSLSPFLDWGIFEIYWDVSSVEPYTIEFMINDQPTIAGSRLISREHCASDYACHNYQFQFCEYDTDFTIECETPNGDTQSGNVADLVYQLPQDLYLILQVCDDDQDYCEYQSRRVTLE